MDKVFAPGRPTFKEGNYTIYDYPRSDTSWRNEIFTRTRHPAKANLHVVKDLIEYISEPGERIMDVMSGTGSIMIAATLGRKVTCIEISEMYTGWIRENKAGLMSKHPEVKDDDITIINSSCQNILPLPCDHICFSPPYAAIMKKKKISANDLTDDFYKMDEETFSEYAKHPGNVGGLNKFLYNMEMEKIYKLCLQSVRPGGKMAILIKDYIEKQQRVFLSDWVQRSCIKMGWEQSDWFKWDAPGGPFLAMYRSYGWETVDDEDLMIFRRPS